MVPGSYESSEMTQAASANCYVKHNLAPLPAPVTVRISFSKIGGLQYISHLDLQRLFGRVLMRAGIPLWYTQGFNPHAKMIFALPLPVGVESECEFLDVRIDKEISTGEIRRLLTEEAPDELRINEVYLPSTKFSDIALAEYEAREIIPGGAFDAAKKINDFFSSDSPVLMNKHTKSGEKEIDIKQYIKSISAEAENDKTVKIKAVLSAGAESLNPEFIFGALVKYSVTPEYPLDKEEHAIVRKKVLCADGTEFR